MFRYKMKCQAVLFMIQHDEYIICGEFIHNLSWTNYKVFMKKNTDIA